MRTVVTALSVLFLALAFAQPAAACSCSAYTAFERVAQKSEMVIVGRVIGVSSGLAGWTYPDDPRYIDLEVRTVAKGSFKRTTLKIWNDWAGSSCGGHFLGVRRGQHIVVAADLVGSVRTDRRQMWEILKFSARDGDAVSNSVCAQASRLLKSDQDLNTWLRKRLK